MNAQLVQKEVKLLLSKSLGEGVCKLIGRANMKQSNVAGLNMITHNMTINLNMLGSFVEDRIGGDMNGGLIITPQSHRAAMTDAERAQKGFKPNQLARGDCHRAVLSFSRRARDGGLLLCLPGDRRFP